jgi:hypothetical protein
VTSALYSYGMGTRLSEGINRQRRSVRERMTEKLCIWKENEEYSMWETSCQNAFEFIEGDIEENSFKFCPYCGKIIKQETP